MGCQYYVIPYVYVKLQISAVISDIGKIKGSRKNAPIYPDGR